MKDRKWPILSQISEASGKKYMFYVPFFICLHEFSLKCTFSSPVQLERRITYISGASVLFANLSDLFPIKLCLKGVLDKIPQMTQFPLFSPNDF